MVPVSLAERHAEEVRHGRHIAADPESVWGQGTDAGALRVARRAQMIIDRAGLRPGVTVLELGCGTGSYTEYFLKTGASVLAIDIAQPLIDRLLKRLPQAKALCASAETLECVEDASVDAVIGNAVLHHLDVPLALATVLRVLKPGGVVCFTEPNMLNPQVALQKNIPPLKRWLGDSPHETAFVRWSIGRVLRRAGFADVLVQPFDFLHPWIPGLLARPVEAMGSALERIPVMREIAGSLILSAHKPHS